VVLPAPVAPEQADDLAPSDGQVDAVDGPHARELAAEEAADGARQPLWLPVELVGLPQVLRLDDRFGR
jgi:hypothetical protein